MNPFDNEDSRYLVLVNDEEQRSLWPESIGVPEGWRVAHGSGSRQNCLDHIDAVWTDIRPKSSRAAGR